MEVKVKAAKSKAIAKSKGNGKKKEKEKEPNDGKEPKESSSSSTRKKSKKSSNDEEVGASGYGSRVGDDGKTRCAWGGGAMMSNYHGELHITYAPIGIDLMNSPPVNPWYLLIDNIWGRPMRSVNELFESLSLQGMQSGLSWRAICNKMDNFKAAFSQFDYNIVADYDEGDRKRLMADSGIIRNSQKINSIINNAKCIRDLERDHKGMMDTWNCSIRLTATGHRWICIICVAIRSS
jgi:hypothetical protein